MKLLYDFKLTTPAGTELHLGIKKPTRLELDDADMMFSKFQSECIQRGILTKEMLIKSYKNFGGTLSNKEEKEYAKIFASFVETQSKLEKAKTKKEKDILNKELQIFYKSLKDIESDHDHLFDRTADVIARNKTILHLTLLMALINNNTESPEWESLYSGDEFEERYASFCEKEELNSKEANAILAKLSLFVTFWYFGDTSMTTEDFKKYDEMTRQDFNEIIAAE